MRAGPRSQMVDPGPCRRRLKTGHPATVEIWTLSVPCGVGVTGFRRDPRSDGVGRDRGVRGMYDVHDWAEVHRLHHVEGLSKAAVAAKLSMSRTTVHRLLALAEPPRCRRRPAGSQVDRFADAIAAMLAEDPRVPATVIAQRLRPLGYRGSVTISEGPSAASAAELHCGAVVPAHLVSAGRAGANRLVGSAGDGAGG